MCAALTPMVKTAALRTGRVDIPSKDRWHTRPTAMLGGIAICAAVGIPLAWFADFGSLWDYLKSHAPGAAAPSHMAVVWLGMTILFVLGLLDDLFRFRPQNKLIVQIVVASLIAFLGYRLQWTRSLTGDTLLTIIWIVGITNAVNLLDNMDGLCAGITAIAAAFFSYLYVIEGCQETMTIALLLLGASAAFLIYNFNPASIFMGDCGSLPLGFTLAMLCVYPASTPVPVNLSLYAVPVLVLMVPIFDTTMVTTIRLLSGRKASVGGRDHTSHRLVLMGFQERGAVLFLYGTSILAGLAAVFVKQHDSLAAPTVIIPLLLSMILMGIYLAQIRVYPEKEFSVLREGRFTPILFKITFKRQLFHVALDLVLIAFAYYLSYRLRFGFGREFSVFFPIFLKSLPAVIICKLVAFFALGVYRGMWRYVGLSDVFVFLKASLLGTLLALALITYVYRFVHFSKGVFLIDWFLTTAFLVGSRVSFRSFREFMKLKTLKGDRVLIYGAGHGGQVLLKEILDNRRWAVRPAGFIDDDAGKVGKRLYGYAVIATGADLENILEDKAIDGIIISCRDMDRRRREKLAALCRGRKLFLKQFRVELRDVEL